MSEKKSVFTVMKISIGNMMKKKRITSFILEDFMKMKLLQLYFQKKMVHSVLSMHLKMYMKVILILCVQKRLKRLRLK